MLSIAIELIFLKKIRRYATLTLYTYFRSLYFYVKSKLYDYVFCNIFLICTPDDLYDSIQLTDLLWIYISTFLIPISGRLYSDMNSKNLEIVWYQRLIKIYLPWCRLILWKHLTALITTSCFVDYHILAQRVIFVTILFIYFNWWHTIC